MNVDHCDWKAFLVQFGIAFCGNILIASILFLGFGLDAVTWCVVVALCWSQNVSLILWNAK